VSLTIIPPALHGESSWGSGVYPGGILPKRGGEIQQGVCGRNLRISVCGLLCGLFGFLSRLFFIPFAFDLLELTEKLCGVVLFFGILVASKVQWFGIW